MYTRLPLALTLMLFVAKWPHAPPKDRSAAPGLASLRSRAFHFCPCKTSPWNSPISQIHIRKMHQAAFIIIGERFGYRPGKGGRREVHLREEELIAYMDGEADGAVKQHIEDCDSCMARLEPYIALQEVLSRVLYRLHCPCSQALGDYHLGLLAEAEASAVREHLAECPYCTAEIETLRQFLAESEVPADYRKSNAQELLRQHKIN